jgi:L-alanine-DL-glutamate epimerase-like enolase superfamily enzyme
VKITAVHVEDLLLEYDEPFVIASSALTAGPCNLVRVETDEGLVGFGEACAGFEFTGDTLWTVSDVINEYLGPAIVGMDPSRIEEIVRIWDRDLWAVGNQAAKGGLEMALWDLLGKATGRPLCDLLGGRTRDALTEVIAFGWDEPEALAAKTRAMRAEGVTIFKIKVGDAPEKDEQRVAAVREAAGCDALITVDANQGWWDAKTAVRAIKLLDPYDVAFVEQPVRMDDLEAARWVRERVDLPIALDESVRGPREALACVEAGACDIFVIKLMKTGGILNALKVNAIGEAAGVTTMIGNMGESSLGLAAHFHVNMALANAVHADADVPTRPGGLKRDIAAGIVAEVRDGVSVVTLGDAPGIGVTIDEAAVAAQRVVRPWQ